MIYIVEGIDRSGKTSFCRHLTEDCNIKSLRIPRPESSVQAFRDAETLLYVVEELELDFFALDRFYPSEFVYHPHYTWKAFEELDTAWSKRAMLYYVVADRDGVLARCAEAGKDIDLNRYYMLMSRWDEFLLRTKLPVAKIQMVPEKENGETTLRPSVVLH